MNKITNDTEEKRLKIVWDKMTPSSRAAFIPIEIWSAPKMAIVPSKKNTVLANAVGFTHFLASHCLDDSYSYQMEKYKQLTNNS